MSRRSVRIAVVVDLPTNCRRKAVMASIVTVELAEVEVRTVHALRQFLILKRTAITSYKTMIHRWTQTIQWWKAVCAERRCSKMDENRPSHHGKDIGCNCIPILCSILLQNHSKGEFNAHHAWNQIIYYKLIYFIFHFVSRTSRNDFKREPCKMFFLDGWTVQLMENPQQVNTFQLVNSQLGTVYKFRTGSPQMTSLWLTSLRRIANAMQHHQHEEKKLPVNLMSFE